MKKLKILLLFSLIFFTSCKSKEEKMIEHLKKEYNEEFKFGFTNERRGATIIEIIPMRFVGTEKEYDNFYSSEVFINKKGTVDDTYKDVLIKEDLEKAFKPKLEELFGKNILIALNLGGRSIYKTLNKEMDRRKERYKIHPNGDFFPLGGGIYIFGRVENEKDREKYRRGIYEFIQYLKQEGMFDYAYIGIVVVDERFLSKNFNPEEFIEKYNADTTKTKENYRKERRELIKKYDNDFKNTTEEEKKDKLENILKSDLFGEHLIGIYKYSGQNVLLGSGIIGEKYIDGKGIREDLIKLKMIPENYHGVQTEKEVYFDIEEW